MGIATWPLGIVLLTGLLWVLGAVLNWHNIRRQERLITRLRRLPTRHGPRRAETAESATLAEGLRQSKRWTVG